MHLDETCVALEDIAKSYGFGVRTLFESRSLKPLPLKLKSGYFVRLFLGRPYESQSGRGPCNSAMLVFVINNINEHSQDIYGQQIIFRPDTDVCHNPNTSMWDPPHSAHDKHRFRLQWVEDAIEILQSYVTWMQDLKELTIRHESV